MNPTQTEGAGEGVAETSEQKLEEVDVARAAGEQLM